MPTLPANLTTLSIEDQDLFDRLPTLDRYRARNQTDWSGQRTAAQNDALHAFQSVKGADPVRCVAVMTAAWKRILVAFTFALVFRSQAGDANREEEARWLREADDLLKSFLFKHDVDESGAIDETVQEDVARVGEITLLR